MDPVQVPVYDNGYAGLREMIVTEHGHVEELPVTDTGMPITGVTLYDNGYAVFQRETTVQGHGHVDLYFPTEHMQSVLESLQFVGDAGKKVGNIAYEATRPTPSIAIEEASPLVGLLRSLTGVRMSLQEKASDARVEGRILGVDRLAVGESELEHASILMDGGVMRTLSVKDITAFHILESQVQQDVNFSLDLVHKSSKENMQKLSVFYNSVENPATLIARYGFKVNEWKSSYRMQLVDHPTKLNLHGLAIVENTLDEDWSDISLTLVVGAPALEKASQSAIDHGEWELTIKALDGSFIKVRANPKDPVLSIKAKVARKKGMPATSFKLVFAGKPVEDGRVLSDYSIRNFSTLHMMKVDGKTGGARNEAGSQTQFVMAAQDNLSYYSIPMRVTAQRKQKAIVPLLEVELEGQKVVLYDETIRKGNPLLAILFENTTGRTLEGGSLQMSSSRVFLGQGTLPTLHPGDESPPIPFAVELNCEVVKQCDTSYLKPHLVTVAEGTVSIYRICRERTVYKIKNKTDKELDFLLNHLFLEDYDLVQNPEVEEEEPVDITDRFYQFRFVVMPNVEKKVFTVREETTDKKEHLIRDLKEETLVSWVEKRLLDKKTEEAIHESFKKKKEIQSMSKAIYQKEAEVREVTSTQERLRENISALERHEKEAAKYIKSLSAEEDRLKSLQTDIKHHRHWKLQLERQMNEKTNEIAFKKEIPRELEVSEA
jgi:hypothetical protein